MRFTKMLDLITNVLNKDADTQVDVCLTSQMAKIGRASCRERV